MRSLLKRAFHRVAGAFGRAAGSELERRLLLEPVFVELLGTTSLETFDVRKFAQILVTFEAADFYNRHLYNAEYYESHLEHLRVMARKAAVGQAGLFLEFGVATGATIREIARASGATIREIARASGRPVVGFDSFQGLPADWRHGVKRGAFAGGVPDVPAGVTLQVGAIEKMLPSFLADLGPGQAIAFMHIDTDLYEPAKMALSLCKPYMRDTIVVFDEFINYPGWRDHEHRALAEFQRESPELEVTYLGLGGRNAVSVRIARERRDSAGAQITKYTPRSFRHASLIHAW